MSERDGRNLSRMSCEVRMVHERAERWARFMLGRFRELGFPAETLLARIARCGFTGAAQHGAPLSPPPDVEEFERSVLKLLQIERSVLIEEYRSHAPCEVKARRLGMSATRYRKLLERTRRALYRDLYGGAAPSA